jgi:long-chain acyl-CoA synthetase
MGQRTLDIISPQEVQSLPGLFLERVRRTPSATAYRYFVPTSHDRTNGKWDSMTWEEASRRVARIQGGLQKEGFKPGDRVAIMLRNCPEWVLFEQAALGLGLVVVPLYTNDRPDNVAYVLQDAGVKLLLLENPRELELLAPIRPQLQGLARILTLEPCAEETGYARLTALDDWAVAEAGEVTSLVEDKNALATLVYTSGTTGRPKGVMLSHYNILFNAHAGATPYNISREDVLLSFLPLSHMLERTLGSYIPMMCGSVVAYARSVQQLGEDLLSQRPTILISVPRIYEKVYNKIYTQLEGKSPFAQALFRKAVTVGWRRFQGKGSSLLWPLLKALVAKKVMARLGGRVRLAVCGGAPLSPAVAETFIGLGLNLIQGYGLTETSPIISGNPEDDNDPASVGIPLPGVEVKIGDQDELLTRSPCVMLGYWQNPEATAAIIDADGWLHTGDQARLENGHIYITGRLKEIIVLANGENVAPADLEAAIALDPLFEQVLVVGEGRPFLAALVVLDAGVWVNMAQSQGWDVRAPGILEQREVKQFMLDRIATLLCAFPRYAAVHGVALQLAPWCIEDETLTPSLKLRRNVILARNQARIDALYAGH